MELENKLAELENMIRTDSSEEVITEYSNCKFDPETVYNYIRAGIIMRISTNLENCITAGMIMRSKSN